MKTLLHVNNISISKEEGFTIDGKIELDTFSVKDSYVSHEKLQMSALDMFDFISCASNVYYNPDKKGESYSTDKFTIHEEGGKVRIIGFKEATGLYDEIIVSYDDFVPAIRDVLEGINIDNITIPDV